MNRGFVLLPSCTTLANLFLNFYFQFIFDWFTRFCAVKLIENIDTQSSSWSESLKSFWFGLTTDRIEDHQASNDSDFVYLKADIDCSTAHVPVLSIRLCGQLYTVFYIQGFVDIL